MSGGGGRIAHVFWPTLLYLLVVSVILAVPIVVAAAFVVVRNRRRRRQSPRGFEVTAPAPPDAKAAR